MSEHAIQDAERNLADLIDRALSGEGVVITREGRPVASLTPIPAALPGRPVTAADLEWLAAHRVPTRGPTEDAAQLVRRMRDEGW